jgi:hypothetical protein
MLDFMNVSDEKIRSLFYKPDRHDRRSLDSQGSIIFPPQANRRTCTQIRDFFDYGLAGKMLALNDVAVTKIDTTGMINYLDSEFASNGESPSRDIPSTSKDVKSVDDEDIFSVDDKVDSTCPGVTMSYVTDMKLDAEGRDRRLLGFKHTIRERFATRSQLEHPDRIGFKWPFCLPVVGAVASGNDASLLVWKVEEEEGYCNTTAAEDGPEFERFTIRHVNCSKGEITKQGLCAECFGKKRLLMDRFDSNVRVRSEDLNIKTRSSLARTGSIQRQRTEFYQRKAKNLSRRLSYKQRALDKLTEEQGMDIQVNETSDAIFNDNVANNVSQFLASDPNDRLYSGRVSKSTKMQSVGMLLELDNLHL